MATTPTVLASSSSVPAPASVVVPTRFPVAPLLIAVVAGVLIAALGIGGVLYYLARTGKLPLQHGAAITAESPATITTHAVVLEPLLVNLADAGGSSYLRVALTLRVADTAGKKAAKPKEEKNGDGDEAVAAVRDTTLMVLGRQTADGLLAADGKEQLKAELRSGLAKHNTDIKVIDIFFTDFLVQR
jgi:flagellar FliL protein